MRFSRHPETARRQSPELSGYGDVLFPVAAPLSRRLREENPKSVEKFPGRQTEKCSHAILRKRIFRPVLNRDRRGETAREEVSGILFLFRAFRQGLQHEGFAEGSSSPGR